MNFSLSPVFYLIGIFLFILGTIMLGPALLCYFNDPEHLTAFLFSSFITVFSASIIIFAFRSEFLELTTRQAFLLTLLTWATLSLFAALPLLLSYENITFIDAYFETMSGLTTTGASIIPNVELLGQGMHLWRAFLGGFGGIGIIVLAIAVLPLMRIGGMQLLMTESTEKSEKFLPRTTQVAMTISLIYVALIAMCATAYWLMGMKSFEAIFYGITTLSTSGFSTHNNSFSYFAGTNIEWVASIFMLLGSMPFVLYLKFIKGRRRAIFFDNEVRVYITLILISALLMAAYKYVHLGETFFVSLRKSLFHVISYTSTTAFVTEDITLWGTVPLTIILIVMMLGGCSGSTAGGIKIFRFHVLLAQTGAQISQLIHHKGIFLPYYNKKPIAANISTAVSNYIFVYICAAFLMTLGLGYFDMDIFEGFSTAVGCLSNVGVSLTTEFGPMDNYADLHDGGKCIMIAGMLLGRLELFSVLIIFLPLFWRN